MIRCNQRRCAAVDSDALKPQFPVEIDMIQPQHRHYARKRAPAVHVVMGSFEMRPEHAGGQPAGPLIKVAKYDPVRRKVFASEDLSTKELAGLESPLKESSSQMQVKDLDGCAGSPLDLGFEATTLLPAGNRNVMIARMPDVLSGEQDVSVGAAAMAPILPEFAGITEIVGKIAGLMMISPPMLNRDDFLQSDHVGIDLAQNTSNAVGADTSVHATTLVDVIGNHTEPI